MTKVMGIPVTIASVSEDSVPSQAANDTRNRLQDYMTQREARMERLDPATRSFFMSRPQSHLAD